MMSTYNETHQEVTTAVPYRPLGLIKELVEAMNLEVTYMYEDLVFVEHNAFLLQMGEKGEDLFIWFNTESAPEERPEILYKLTGLAAELSLVAAVKGLFSMQQNDETESFQLEFISQKF